MLQKDILAEVTGIIESLEKLEHDFENVFMEHESQGIVPPYVSRDILKHFTQKLDKALEFQSRLIKIVERWVDLLKAITESKEVSDSIRILLTKVHNNINAFDEIIKSRVAHYQKLVQDQKISNQTMREVREARQNPTGAKSSDNDSVKPVASQHGFFTAKKIALSVGVVGVTVAGLVYAKMG